MVSLAEMQELARRSAEAPGDGDSEEERNWLEKLRTKILQLRAGCRKNFALIPEALFPQC